MKLWSKLKALFTRRRLEREMAEEMSAHLDGLTERNIAKGMSPEEARYAAQREFGGVEQIKERARDVRGWVWLEQLGQDLRYGFRQLRKSPGFTSVAVLSLALGIGANTAIFSLVNEMLLKSLPVRNPDELVLFQWTGGVTRSEGSFQYNGDDRLDPVTKQKIFSSFSFHIFERFRSQLSDLKDIFAFAPLEKINAIIEGEPEVVPLSQVVSGNYFTSLGVASTLGRELQPADDKLSAPPVAVISYRYWQQRFGGAPDAINQSIRLNGVPFEIVGVTPDGFSGTLQIGESPDFYIPLSTMPQMGRQFAIETPWFWWLRIMGRLRPDGLTHQAKAQLEIIFTEEASQPQSAGQEATSGPVAQLSLSPGGQGLNETRYIYRQSLMVLMGIVGLVLLIACVNLANLLLARGMSRRKEIAMRLALGASRARIIRQLLTESLMLAFAGSGLGFLFAHWGKELLLELRPEALRSASTSALVLDLNLDLRVLALTIGTALLTGVIFGLAPALRATRINLVEDFQTGGRNGPSSGRSRPAKGFMITQVALSLVLLVGAFFFVQSLGNLQKIDVGFNRDHLLLFNLDATKNKMERALADALYERVSERIAALPGVVESTYSRLPILGRNREGRGIELPGHPVDASRRMTVADFNYVASGFFETMGMPIIRGRSFRISDTAEAPKVCVINQAFAQQLFGGENPIGVNMYPGGEIVGIVRDARFDDLRNPAEPLVYVPFPQAYSEGPANFVIKTGGDSSAVTVSVRQAVNAIDPNLPLYDVHTMDQQIGRLLQQELLFTKISGFFGLLSLGLVSIGMYGLMSFTVTRRTNEIGIRLALGAQTERVLWMIIYESLLLLIIGVAMGLVASIGAVQLISNMLYGLSPADPITYAWVALILIVVALLACWLPARRAAKVDPMEALRCE